MINLPDRYLKKEEKTPNNPRFKKQNKYTSNYRNRNYLRTIKVKQNIPNFGRNIDTYV